MSLERVGESPSGKAPDFDSGIRRFDPFLPCQARFTTMSGLQVAIQRNLRPLFFR